MSKDEYVSGERVSYVTPGGSHVTIDSRIDGYGRGYSHAVSGTGPDNRNRVLARNVYPSQVLGIVERYEEMGYRSVAAYIETF